MKAFASATSALTSAAKSAGDLNIEIDGKFKLTEAATTFASGKADTLQFPAPEGEFISGHSNPDWKAIQAFLSGVNAYADALAKANDPKLETGLTDKVSGLTAAMSKALAVRDATTKNPKAAINQQRAQFIGAIVVDIVSIASNIYAGYVIQEVMGKVHPLLKEARQPLTRAINAIIEDDKTKLEHYLTSAQSKLVAVPKNSAFLARYDAYVALNQDYRAIEARVAALDGLDKAIGAMIEAHGKLKDDLDSKTALLGFLQSVGDIIDKIEKVEALRKQS